MSGGSTNNNSITVLSYVSVSVGANTFCRPLLSVEVPLCTINKFWFVGSNYGTYAGNAFVMEFGLMRIPLFMVTLIYDQSYQTV